VRRYPLEAVAHGWRELDLGHDAVVLRLRDRTEVMVAELSDQEADALLAAAGVDIAARSLVVEIEPPRRLSGPTSCLMLLVAVIGVPALVHAAEGLLDAIIGRQHPTEGMLVAGLLLPLSAAACWVLMRSYFTTRITIGRDGVHVRRPLRRGRFLRHEEIEDASMADGRLQIDLPAGTLRLQAEREQGEAIERRIEDARRRLAAEHAAGDPAPLDRRGQPVAEWPAAAGRFSAHHAKSRGSPRLRLPCGDQRSWREAVVSDATALRPWSCQRSVSTPCTASASAPMAGR
jgi:hypothetical protein